MFYLGMYLFQRFYFLGNVVITLFCEMKRWKPFGKFSSPYVLNDI